MTLNSTDIQQLFRNPPKHDEFKSSNALKLQNLRLICSNVQQQQQQTQTITTNQHLWVLHWRSLPFPDLYKQKTTSKTMGWSFEIQASRYCATRRIRSCMHRTIFFGKDWRPLGNGVGRSTCFLFWKKIESQKKDVVQRAKLNLFYHPPLEVS